MSVAIPSRFGTYELFRILFPGYFALTMVILYTSLFFRDFVDPIVSQPSFAVVIALGGIFLGLILYDVDLPKRKWPRRYKSHFRKELDKKDLGKALLERCTKCRKKTCTGFKLSEKNAIQAYFVFLNSYYEPDCRERIFYFGSIYHIFSDMRATSFVTALAVLVTTLFSIIHTCVGAGACFNVPSLMNRYSLHISIGAILLCLFLLLRRKNNKGDKYWSEILDFQLTWLQMNEPLLRQKICRTEDSGA